MSKKEATAAREERGRCCVWSAVLRCLYRGAWHATQIRVF